MRRLFFQLMVGFFCVFGWSALQAASKATKATQSTKTVNASSNLALWMPDIKAIKARGELIVAMTSGKSPLFQMEDSQKQKVGVDIQLIRDLAASLDVKLKIIDTFKGNEDIVDYVANNKADIGVAKMSYSVERSRRVFCSIPYQIVKMAMLVNRQELTRTSGDLSVLEFLNRAETKIGVVRQSAYSQFAKQLFPNAKIVEGDWDKDIIPQITRGELTAAFRDEIRVKSHLKLNPRASLDLYPLVFKHQTDPILIVSRPNSTQLYIWINSFLTYHAKSSQTVDELMSKYGDYIK